ncbi:MAG: hypothetical protein J5719_01975 [Bacteroidales bacterium]|nr:hypothetical protein [Bacteroidales bacterium]
MKKLLFLTLLALVSLSLTAQKINLTFVGVNAQNAYLKQDSIVVTNLNRNWTLTLHNPDTVLTLTATTGIANGELREAGVGQNVPNPFDGTTSMLLSVPERQSVRISVYDMNGREVLSDKRVLSQGDWALHLTLTVPQTYLLSVKMKDYQGSVKMINVGHGGSNSLSYSGIAAGMLKLETKKPFAVGDKLQVKGYTTYKGGVFTAEQSINPEGSQRVVLQYALTNPRAPEMITYPYFHLTDSSFYSGGYVQEENGAEVTECGVCWDTLTKPTVDGLHTVQVPDNVMFTSFISGLRPNTTYYVRCYGMNKYGISYGNQITVVTNDKGLVIAACPGDSLVTDIDGNVYSTIQVGDKCWMKQNMRVRHYPDGSAIPVGAVNKESYTEPYWYYPYGNEENEKAYGLLYNFTAMMKSPMPAEGDNQGICPNGWHVATDVEWANVLDYILAKEDYNYAKYFCNDNSLDLEPAGYFYDSQYYTIGFSTMVWNSTSFNETSGFMRMLAPENGNIFRYGFKKCAAMSVRCVKN